MSNAAFQSNTLGLPTPGNYYVGKGQVFLSKLDPITNLPLVWRHIGNSNMLEIDVKTTKIQHQSSQQALARSDDEASIKQDATMTVTCDELSAENLALFFSGDTANSSLAAGKNPANPTVAGFTATPIAIANVSAGAWYDIQTTGGIRAFDILNAAEATALSTGGVTIACVSPSTGGTLTEGTDYILDAAMGRFQLTAAGYAKSITTAPGTLSVVVAADSGSVSHIQRTRAETSSPVPVAVKLVGLNARNANTRQEIQCHSVLLTANGKLSLISDKYTEMSFDGLLRANPAVDANSPYMTASGLDAPRN